MVERLGVMLNFNLKQLCGPENKGLIVSEGGTAGRHTYMDVYRLAGVRMNRQMTDADTHSCTIHAPLYMYALSFKDFGVARNHRS